MYAENILGRINPRNMNKPKAAKAWTSIKAFLLHKLLHEQAAQTESIDMWKHEEATFLYPDATTSCFVSLHKSNHQFSSKLWKHSWSTHYQFAENKQKTQKFIQAPESRKCRLYINLLLLEVQEIAAKYTSSSWKSVLYRESPCPPKLAVKIPTEWSIVRFQIWSPWKTGKKPTKLCTRKV